MTRQNPLWQQASSYPATLDRYLINTIWPNGGAVGVLPSAVTGTMNVQIPAGTAVVPLTAGQGSALCRWDATETVTVAAAPPSGQSRIDVVVLQVRDNQLDAGPNNDFVFNVVQGTPAASNPAVPATPSNALAMVNVTVVGAVVNLNGATITPVVPGLGGASGSRPTAGGFLAADTGALASAFTTYMTSPVLQNGLWLVFAGFLGNATVGANMQARITNGTAVCTFIPGAGVTQATVSSEIRIPAGTLALPIFLQNLVQITQPGTLVFQAAAQTGSTILKAGPVSGNNMSPTYWGAVLL